MTLARFLKEALLVGTLAVAGAGCASYSHKALPVRDPLSRGDLAAAEAFLVEEKPGGDGLPYLMELGLVLRYQEEYVRSNEMFEAAEVLVDELYTKSISKEALALITSDEAIPYDGEMWERALINYYRALNYIDLGDYEGALVECRKLNHKLSVYVDASDDPPTYETDAFAQYLTAMLYEVGGRTNDAWVSLRLADDAYAHYEEAYGVATPLSLQRDLIRLAQQQGYRDHEERLRERFPDAEPPSAATMAQKAEIVVFWEEGFIPAKIQKEATIPILKDSDDQDHEQHVNSLRHRYYHPQPYKKKELAYLLRFALPAFPPPTAEEQPGWADVGNGSVSTRSEVVQDLSKIARHGLDDRMGGILFKSILRALSKYALTAGVESEGGKAAGRVFNFLTAAAEKADTRSWITLPKAIQVARLLVEPGTHDIALDCFDAQGRPVESVTFEGVVVQAGEVQFLSHRTF